MAFAAFMGKLPIAAKSLLFFVLGFLGIGAMLFVPAGTLYYWQGWLYMLALFVPIGAVLLYFLARDPALLERRFEGREKEARQKMVVKLGGIITIIGFLLPGLDRRFGWSNVPSDMSLAAALVVFLGYCVVFAVFRENSFAGRTVRVEKGQKVISTGPYSMVRHPMYSGMLLLILATPIALGSYVAFPPFLLWLPLLVMRIGNEEEVLKRELSGYREYCKKVKYRLVPGVW